MKCLETRTRADGIRSRRYELDDGRRITMLELPATVIKGIGMKRVQEFMEIWQRGEQQRTDSLARRQRIVEMLGGTIGFESEPGKGSCFWFEVPAARSEALAEAAGAQRAERERHRRQAQRQHVQRVVPALPVGALERRGIDTAAFSSKSWDEFSAPDAPLIDLAITVCGNAAGEACPVFLGSPLKAHWGLPDPADVNGTEAEVDAAFEETWRLLEMRVRAFLAIDRAALGSAALQAALANIGAMEGGVL